MSIQLPTLMYLGNHHCCVGGVRMALPVDFPTPGTYTSKPSGARKCHQLSIENRSGGGRPGDGLAIEE